MKFLRACRPLWRPLGGWHSKTHAGVDTFASPARRGGEHGELISLVLAVFFAIFVTKAVIAYRDLDDPQGSPQIFDGWLFPTLGRIGACCAQDLAVGFACLLVGAGALQLRSSPRYRLVVRILAHAAAIVAIGYMVVNAQIYHVIGCFLTTSLFELGGGLKLERSIYEYATPSVKLALIVLPLLTLTLHLSLVRAFPRFWRWVSYCLCRPAVLVLLIAGLFIASHGAREDLFAESRGDFAENAHLLFARSFFRPAFPDEGEEQGTGDYSDFLPGRPQQSVGRLDRRPSNIILIVLESAGSGHMQAYGSPLPTTPNLCRLQSKGLTFDDFYATGNHTIASALPIFGSLYNDPRTLSTVIEHPNFPVPSAASWLQKHGYQTYFLGSGGKNSWEHYRNLAPAFLSKGFDVARDSNHPFWHQTASPTRFEEDDYLDDAMFADARRCLRAARGQKFFLMLWSYETHAPYFEGDGPGSWDARSFPAAVTSKPEKEQEFRRYLDCLWRVDRLIGDLYRDLEKLGLADDTLVVITGDHGEAFGQHGWFYHGWSVYEEEVRVPLIFICPRLAGLGTHSKVLGSHVDLWPTITDACGVPADPRWQGRSLLGGDPREVRRAYFYRHTYMLGVRQGRYKYIRDYLSNCDRLYDLKSDPGEQQNLAESRPGFCREERRRLQDWITFQDNLTKERLLEANR